MSRELTANEKRQIKNLVVNCCANFCKDYGCLLLDSNCYMLGKFYANDKLCRYFRDYVLPLNSELTAVFSNKPTKACKICGKKFPVKGRQTYCSKTCSDKATKSATAARVRKHREKQLQQPELI